MLRWVSNILLSLSQMLNAICGGLPDETLSGRAHREWPTVEKWIDRLFFWEPHHCQTAHARDIIAARAFLFGRGK